MQTPPRPEPAPQAWWARWLTRPLAEDEHRARFWVNHVRMGVVLTEVTALAVLAYVQRSETADRPALRALIGAVLLLSPGLLALPVTRIARHRNSTLLPTLWTLALILVVSTGAALDGGADSPLALLLFLTLAFAGLAYRPAGVAVLGVLMILADLVLLVNDTTPVTAATLIMPLVLALVTAMTAWAAHNQWENYDRQLALAEQLATLVAVDELTGALTRRGLLERLAGALPRPGEHTLLVVDLDGFKSVNDVRGHEEGNTVLLLCADAMRSALRSDDAVGRLGGDEFAVLLPDTPPEAGARVAEDVRRAVAEAGLRWGVTASVGVATRLGPTTAQALLVAADEAMYEAKRAGRNRVMAATTCRPDAVATGASPG